MTVRERYEAAVESLVEKLQQDRTVLAAVLAGSLAYDDVWEKSDIDLAIIVDEKVKKASFTLAEDGISIHASLMPRSAFKQQMERALQGSFGNSMLARSRLLFSKDESLALLWENAGAMGERDRMIQLLGAGIACLPVLAKAEKWFSVKRDWRYAGLYILFTANALARVETVAAGDNPGREVIHQALRHNPAFFKIVYNDILDGPQSESSIGAALAAIDGYLTERISLLFSPILEYLAEAGGPRGARELNEHFTRQMQAEAIDLACDWLADKGILERVPIPLRLSKDSRVTVYEAGYFYAGEVR